MSYDAVEKFGIYNYIYIYIAVSISIHWDESTSPSSVNSNLKGLDFTDVYVNHLDSSGYSYKLYVLCAKLRMLIFDMVLILFSDLLAKSSYVCQTWIIVCTHV